LRILDSPRGVLSKILMIKICRIETEKIVGTEIVVLIFFTFSSGTISEIKNSRTM